MKTLILIASLFFAMPLLAYEAFRLDEFEPSPVQRQLMDIDHVQQHFALAPDGAIWLMGETSFWRWYPLTGAVSKLLVKGILPSLKMVEDVEYHRGEALIISASRVWRVNLKTGELNVLSGKWDDRCTQSRFAKEKSRILVSNSCGIFFLNQKKNSIVTLKVPSDIQGLTFLTGGYEDGVLIGGKSKNLYRISIDQDQISRELQYVSKSNLSGVDLANGYVYAWHEKVLAVLDPNNLSQIQIVPNISTRKLSFFAASADLHIALFNDGTIELMYLPTKRKFANRLVDFDVNRMTLEPGAAFLVLTGLSFPRVIDLTTLMK
ncbi:MAG: hypothetical protein NT027_06515 [Proteobacteria bacterium]|nr:hypothetical protein [Pseudomonadota bacterium]